MNTKFSKLALAIGALVMAGGAWAVDDTSTIGVSATVEAACSVGAGTAIGLSSLVMITADGTTSTADSVATNTFPAICTNGTTLPKFAYSSANDASGVFQLIGATTATEFIAYTLHQDATGTLAAVAKATAIAHPAFTANGVSQTLSLAAKIVPAAKNGKSVQAYSDTVTITSSFGV